MKTLYLSAFGILSLGLSINVAAADTPEANALAHNAAFETGAASGISPQSFSEMLGCSAVWDRWEYAVSSAADRKFTGALRRELSAANAKRRKISWQREARRETDEDDDTAYFESNRADAESDADEIYAAYANNEEGGMYRLMNWLGTCK